MELLNRALKIVMVAPRPLSGIRTHLSAVIPRLSRMGHSVVVVSQSQYNWALKDLNDILVDSYKLASTGFSHYCLAPSLHRVINRLRRSCDLFHIHGYTHFFADYLTVTRGLYKIPIVMSFHGTFHSFTTARNYYLKTIHNAAMIRFRNNVDKYVVVSNAERNAVVDAGIPETRVNVVYNGVDPRYAMLSPSRLSRSQKNILYIGRLSPSKNLQTLVRAIGEVSRKLRVTLTLVGPDWGEKTKLRMLADRIGLGGHVTFAGELSEEKKAEYLSTAALYVDPSVRDVFSLSILEASASGLPVVAFDQEGNREMVIDGRTGLLVEAVTEHSLADAIITLLKDEERAGEMGEEGQRFVLETFSWDKTAHELERVYVGALALR